MPDRRKTGEYDSRTETADHLTATEIGKQYDHEVRPSDNPDKRSARQDDGHVSSHEYYHSSSHMRHAAQAAVRKSGGADDMKTHVDLDYTHPLERVLDTKAMQWLLGFLARPRPGRNRKTLLEEILMTYGNPDAPGSQRMKYWPFHKFIDRMKGSVPTETIRRRIGEHIPVIRGLVITARSVSEYGLRVPQRFSSPLFAVWNFTNQCNLRCQHCYQDSHARVLPNELTLDEKLALVDEMAAEYLPMIAFAGGEPTISPDLLPVLHRCKEHGVHVSIATNGTRITPAYAEKLAEAGVKYVEISLDSIHPARHDAFRGQPGMWHRSVGGMVNVIRQEGLRLGVAMCVHQGNFHEIEDTFEFLVELGASCFAHFNFIPVGRGLKMTKEDLNPHQRQELLETMNRWMQSGKIGVISTSPQFGRICLAHAPIEGKQACAHTGAGGGEKARVLSKYIGGCGAGRCYVAIEADGTITPCVYMPQRVYGNVRNRRFIDLFRDNEFWDVLCDRDQRLHHCEVCEFKNCCGGCRARADAYFGQIHAGDPGCIFNEKHWDSLVAESA